MNLSKKIRQCCVVISLCAVFIASCSNGIDAQNADQTSMLHLKGLSYDSLKITFFRFYSAVEPEDLSALGFHDNDSLWKDWSPNKIEKEKSFYKAMVNELTSRLVNGQLSTSQILDFQWMRTIAQFKVNFYDQNRHLANIRISSSPIATLTNQTLRGQISDSSAQVFYGLWKSIGIRIQKIPAFLAIQEANMVKGLNSEIVPNKLIYNAVVTEINDQIKDSFFLKLPSRASSFLSKTEIINFTKSCYVAEKTYRAHLDWLNKNIANKAISNDNFRLGRDEYEKRLKDLFYTNESVESLEEIGLSEMRSINIKMQNLATKILKEDINSPEKLRDAIDRIRKLSHGKKINTDLYRKVQDTLVNRLSQLGIFDFANSTAFKLQISEMPPGIGGQPPAANWPALIHDYLSKGIFLVDVKSPMPFNMTMAVCAHEGIPGHYYQSFIWQIQFGKSNFPIRFVLVQDEENYIVNCWATAINVEGWALYVERLLEDSGFYSNDIEHLEALALISLRATRVVFDIGLHAKKMSIDSASRLLYIYGFDKSLSHAKSQIQNRYSILPMQAMTYIIGATQIENLKKKFLLAHPGSSLMEFHNAFLNQGPLPPNLIEPLLK